MQFVKRILAVTAEFESTGQAVQAAVPLTALYLPATQAVQASLYPVYPR
jgi:hypothetical protein